MASAKRIHVQCASHRGESWRHVQNVLHEFHHRQEPFLRRNICRSYTEQTHSLHGQIRRSEHVWRNADYDHVEESFMWNGTEHRPGRRSGHDTGRGLLSWLAGIAYAVGET